MHKTVGMFEAKTKFSELCEQVVRTGKEIVVTRRGKSMVRILPVVDPGQEQTAGVLDRLRENEALHGKAGRMKQDFPDVWRTRVSKTASPLDDE